MKYKSKILRNNQRLLLHKRLEKIQEVVFFTSVPVTSSESKKEKMINDAASQHMLLFF